MSNSDEVARICIGCTVESGGDSLSLIIALAGVAISLISAAVSVWAITTTSKNHDSLILREEFQPHRALIEASLKILGEKAQALELSISPGLPWTRVESNFVLEQADTELSALAILDEARSIDERGLFPQKWEHTLRLIYISMENSWIEVDRIASPEPARRAAALAVVQHIQNYISTTKTFLEAGVKAPLAKKRWT